VKVEWTPRGELRLRQCRAYILGVSQDPLTAYKFEDDIIDTSLQLADFPRSGRMVPEIGRPNIRELLYKDYRIIYRYTAKCCYILSVRHGMYLIKSLYSL